MRRLSLLYVVALAAATLLVYKPAWHGGFVWDDDMYVTHNPLLSAPDGLRRIWFSLDSPSQYFPLTYTTFRFERALWGLDPTGYHFVNIALHITNALLVWRVLTLLRIPGAPLAAAIFALHPVQVESVAWITERKNVLMGAFFLSALWCWIRFVEVNAERRLRYYPAAIVLYALALCSKTTACTLAAALLLVLWWKRQPINRARILQIAPFVLLGLAMGLVSVWWERFHQGTRGAMFALSPLERVLVASRAIWFYLGKLFWPAKLTFIYPSWEIHASDPMAYVPLIALAIAAALIWILRRRFGRGPEVAFLFFVATLAPVLGFIMLYTFRYTFVADHYQYLACIGPIALVSAVATVNLRRWQFYAFSAATIAMLASLTWRQAGSYRDIETLWRMTLARDPHSWMAHNNLGIELALRGRDADAVQEYRRTVELRPQFPEAHYNLANSLLKLGDVSAALAQAKIAIELRSKDPDAHTSLGNALRAAGRDDAARTEFETAIKLRPGDPFANYNLGLLLLQHAQAGAAIEHFRAALEQRDDANVRVMLANALLGARQTREAIIEFERVLSSDPNNVIALCNLAWALATAPEAALLDGRKALAFAQKANELSQGNDPVVLRSLAAAYAEAGEMQNAIEMAEAARERAVAAGQQQLVGAIDDELAAFRRGTPYREQ